MVSNAYSEMRGLRWKTSFRGLIFGSSVPNVPLTQKSGSPLIQVGILYMFLSMTNLAAISLGPSPWGGIDLLIWVFGAFILFSEMALQPCSGWGKSPAVMCVKCPAQESFLQPSGILVLAG